MLWCGQQDSNLHAFAVEPKSTESTNSTMPASRLFYHGLGVIVNAEIGEKKKETFCATGIKNS